MQGNARTSSKKVEVGVTQVVKKDKDETIESIRKRIEKVSGRKTPELWKKMFPGKKKDEA